MKHHTLLAATILAFLLATTSCSQNLSLDEWESVWQETNAALPALSDVDIADPLEVCSAALGSVRQAASDLIDAPNDDLAEAFLRWSDFAESVYFNCPPADGVHAGFAASYEEMERLSAEIEALLTFEHDLRG